MIIAKQEMPAVLDYYYYYDMRKKDHILNICIAIVDLFLYRHMYSMINDRFAYNWEFFGKKSVNNEIRAAIRSTNQFIFDESMIANINKIKTF